MPDLRLSEMEKKDFSTPSAGPKAPKYPYGLKITLGPEELEKLGISELPQVDSFVDFEAKAQVVGVSVHESEGDVNEHRLELQITEIYMKDKKEEKSTESALYGG